MPELTFLRAYPQATQMQELIASGQLGPHLAQKYPQRHLVQTDSALYAYAMVLKQQYLRNAAPLSKVVFDGKINLVQNALGLHTTISRVQGHRLKSKNEIRIAALFKAAPSEFLKMIVVHELAHLKEKAHDKAFYQLCEHMEPAYHQLEFDLRLYLTWLLLERKLV